MVAAVRYGYCLDSRVTRLTGPDADDLINTTHENLSIANAAGSGCSHDCLDGAFAEIIGYDRFDFDFR